MAEEKDEKNDILASVFSDNFCVGSQKKGTKYVRMMKDVIEMNEFA